MAITAMHAPVAALAMIWNVRVCVLGPHTAPKAFRRPSCMSDFSADDKKILRENDCSFVRHGNGDHDIWHSLITDHRCPVDAKIKSRHTANGIMKQAGLPKAF